MARVVRDSGGASAGNTAQPPPGCRGQHGPEGTPEREPVRCCSAGGGGLWRGPRQGQSHQGAVMTADVCSEERIKPCLGGAMKITAWIALGNGQYRVFGTQGPDG